MMRSLSVQRMQLSDDPDDWIWVRWQWSELGAKAMPWFHAFGFGLLEDWRADADQVVQIAMRPSQYRGSEVSPYPGTHVLGEKDWWQNGLPVSARRPGDVGDGCVGEIWDVRVPLSLDPHVESAPGELWGIDAPLSLDPQVAWLWGAWQVAEGGQVEGGTAAQGGPSDFVGSGGQAQGGQAVQYGLPQIASSGGQAEGGEAEQSSGYALVAEGGQAQGGEADQWAAYLQISEGGQAQGGEAEQEGIDPPTPPTFRSGSRNNGIGSTAVTKPTGTASGDVLVAFAVTNNDSAGITLPSGWATVASGTWGVNQNWVIASLTAGGSEPASYTFSCHAMGNINVAMIAYSGSSGVEANGSNTGNSTAVVAPTVTSGGAARVLVCGYHPLTSPFSWTPPSGMTQRVPSIGVSPPPVMYDEVVGAGATGTRTVTISPASAFVTMSVILAPV